MIALIVIELDENEPFYGAGDIYNRLKGYKCEIVTMPKIRTEKTKKGIAEDLFNEGYNACIDEILSETLKWENR